MESFQFFLQKKTPKQSEACSQNVLEQKLCLIKPNWSIFSEQLQQRRSVHCTSLSSRTPPLCSPRIARTYVQQHVWCVDDTYAQWNIGHVSRVPNRNAASLSLRKMILSTGWRRSFDPHTYFCRRGNPKMMSVFTQTKNHWSLNLCPFCGVLSWDFHQTADQRKPGGQAKHCV